jgi:hypothetical protein
MCESSLAGVLEEFVLRKLTKTKQQAEDPSPWLRQRACKRGDPAPPAKNPSDKVGHRLLEIPAF